METLRNQAWSPDLYDYTELFDYAGEETEWNDWMDMCCGL